MKHQDRNNAFRIEWNLPELGPRPTAVPARAEAGARRPARPAHPRRPARSRTTGEIA